MTASRKLRSYIRDVRTATGLTWDQLRSLRYAVEDARSFSAEQRRKASKEGASLGDGSYPIYNQTDLNNAVRRIGTGGASADTIKAHIRKRAKALGLKLPDAWASGNGS
jgi:hypothetical protein